MQTSTLLIRALNGEFLSQEEGTWLFKHAPLGQLMLAANAIRKKQHASNEVSWIIDRNVNITNICVSRCRFCNFHRVKGSSEGYVTTIDEYKQKIDEMYKLGGRQLLLQGGMFPDLDIAFYENLFSTLKSLYPDLKLHALGPAEIAYISKLDNLTYKQTLERLVNAGLDSLPGAGAEILSDRVRKFVSPGKCNATEWLNVMRAAHRLGLITSATMMFGHAETVEERIEHFVKLRQVQSEKPEGTPGFISFTCWPFQDEGTRLREKYDITNKTTFTEYIRMVALARIMLPNIPNIQASWLTVGIEAGMFCLHGGANDMGSIMIEENVVSAAGASHHLDARRMQETICKAGFVPHLRNQRYELIDLPVVF
jgi:cyclic dehypoxanthinyl futalosine synthase